MSKNRRKSLKKRTCNSKRLFCFDESKIYIIATIIMFHNKIACICSGCKKTVNYYCYNFSHDVGNPMFIALSGLIYGIKQGFNFNSIVYGDYLNGINTDVLSV